MDQRFEELPARGLRVRKLRLLPIAEAQQFTDLGDDTVLLRARWERNWVRLYRDDINARTAPHFSRIARGSGLSPASQRQTVRGPRVRTSAAKRLTERPDDLIAAEISF